MVNTQLLHAARFSQQVRTADSAPHRPPKHVKRPLGWGREAQVKRSGMPPTGAECPYLQQRGLSAAHLTSRNRGIMRFPCEGTRPFTAFAADMATYTVISQ